MKKASVWIGVAIVLGGIFYLSSISGLRVLPIFKQLNSFLLQFDVFFVKLAEIISMRLPIDTNELRPIQNVSNDFYYYVKTNPLIMEFILRKIAHIFVFFWLNIVLFFAINQYTKKSISASFIAFILSFLFAVMDEYRQSFVDGRVSSAIDVGIDLIGIILATLLILFSIFITKKWSDNKGPIHL
jgi:VanZ family protein